MTKEELIEKIEKEGTLILSEDTNNSVIENIKKNPDVKNYSLMIGFAQKYGVLTFRRIEKESRDKLVIHINVIALTYPNIISAWHGKKKNVVFIASISNVSGQIESFFMKENGEFFNSENELIADNEDGFFEYLFTVEYDYHTPIKQQTLEILKDAGWFEGRKTDISGLISKYQKQGITLSDAQIAFMQEFGGIKGKGSHDEEFEICIEPKYSIFEKSKPLDSKDLTSYNPLNVVGNKENVDFLLAGTTRNDMVRFWISTDGRLFEDQGVQRGRSIMEGLQWFLLK